MFSKPSRQSYTGLRLALYILTLPIILFYVLTLIGCTSESSGITNIYLINLRSVTSKSGAYKWSMKVNYFGLCMSGPKEFGTSCISTSGRSQASANKKLSKLEGFSKEELQDWISLAYTLKDHIFLYLIVPAMTLFCLALISHFITDLCFRSRTAILRSVTVFLATASITLAIVAAVGTTQTANAVKYFTDPKKWVAAPKGNDNQGSWSATTGPTIQFLQFMVFVLECVWVILSQRILQGEKTRGDYSYNMS